MRHIKSYCRSHIAWMAIPLSIIIFFIGGTALYGYNRNVVKSKSPERTALAREDIKPDWVETVEIDGKKYQKIYMSSDKLARKFGNEYRCQFSLTPYPPAVGQVSPKIISKLFGGLKTSATRS